MKKGQYRLGLFYIMIVNFLWVLGPLLVKDLYVHDEDISFLITYFSTTLFSVYLIVFLPLLSNECITTSHIMFGYKLRCTRARSVEISEERRSVYPKETSQEVIVEQDNIEVDTPNGEVFRGQLIKQKEKRWNEKRSLVEASDQVTCCYCCVVKQSTNRLPLLATAKISFVFCFIWFGMNYTSNISLRYTRQASNQALSLLSGPFCLILTLLVFAEPLNWGNIIGVAVVLCGSILIFVDDMKTGEAGTQPIIIGDSLAIISAFIYASWTTLIKFCLVDESKMSISLFLGLLGLCNGVILWPLFFLLNRIHYEPLQMPDNRTFQLLTAIGFINIFSDFLWAKSILLTSPVIATIGLTLTVPLSFVADYYRQEPPLGPMSYAGATCVVAGFLLVNIKASLRGEPNIELRNSFITKEMKEEQEKV